MYRVYIYTHIHRCVYNSEWRECRLAKAEQDPEAAANLRPSSRTWKYADLPKQAVRMRASHGDIPAWAPKVIYIYIYVFVYTYTYPYIYIHMYI